MPRDELLCPVLVGREDEHANLLAALERAQRGQPQAIFLTGDAGVGKSRLCETLCQDAAARGLVPLLGHASAHDHATPYGPIVAALERAFRRWPPDRPPLDGPLRPHLATLSVLFPGLPREGGSGGEQAEAAHQRRRVFEALSAALLAVAGMRGEERGAPPATLVLILEDLHWADETTVDFMQHLVDRFAHDPLDRLSGAAGEGQGGLLLVGTYRTGESPGPQGPAGQSSLVRAVADLVRRRLARELALEPLAPAEHASMLAAILGRPVSVSVAQALYERSDGNPFVTEELLGAMAASGQITNSQGAVAALSEGGLKLPLSLQAAVLARLEGLSQETQHLLSMAAVIGREFEFEVLQRLSGAEERALLAILREAMQRGILTENAGEPGAAGGEERYRFRHALTRDAVAGRLMSRERRLLHRSIAEALEETLPAALRAGPAAGRLARHFTRAGEHGRAQPYAVAAAEHALRVGALAEAAGHLERAIEALPDGDAGRVGLLELQGTILLALMQVPRAGELLGQARTTARDAGMRWRAAAIGADLAFLSWFADPLTSDREWRGFLAEAQTRIESGEPGDETALRIYASAALGCGSHDDQTGALVWSERAITLAASLDPACERLLPRAYVGRGMALGENGDVEAGIADLQHALALGIRYADPLVALAYNVLIMLLCETGRDEQALAVFAQASEFERRTGAIVAPPPVLYAYLALGRWEEGLAVARAQVEGYGTLGIPTTPQGLAMTGLGHLLERQGRAEEALERFQAAWGRVAHVRDFAWGANTLWGLARAQAALGHREAAGGAYGQCLAWWRRTEDRGTAVPILLDALLFALENGELGQAETLADDLERVAQYGNPVATSAAAQGGGQLAAARGDQTGSLTRLEAAVAGWAGLGRPYDEARARRHLGQALLAGGREAARRAEADAQLAAAEQRFAALGAGREAEVTTEIRRRAGLLSQARRRSTMEAARASVGGLTPREREVLQCLAEGKTNREIAAALYIAESTAELHVSRILGKLNCATRAQAAALAAAQGWAHTGGGTAEH